MGRSTTATVQSLFNAGSKLAAITLSPMSHEELINAVKDGNSVECARLLEANADPDLQDDEDGFTALMWNAERGHPAVCAQLLEANADPDLQHDCGNTALITAAREGHLEVCAQLLEANADPDLQDEDGYTALMGAADHGHLEVCAQLLEAKANPDLKNEDGDTALMLAKEMLANNQGNSEVCDLLEKALEQAPEQDVNRVRSEWV